MIHGKPKHLRARGIGKTVDRAILAELIEKAKTHIMTPQEIWDQRVSFVYGNLPETSNVTMEQVKASATKEYGPRPE